MSFLVIRLIKGTTITLFLSYLLLQTKAEPITTLHNIHITISLQWISFT